MTMIKNYKKRAMTPRMLKEIDEPMMNISKVDVDLYLGYFDKSDKYKGLIRPKGFLGRLFSCLR